MSESDLDDALKDLDLGDDPAEGGEGEVTAETGSEEAAEGEEIQLDDDLEAALAEDIESTKDAGGGADAGGDDADFDLDAELNALKEDSSDAPAEEGAPPPVAAKAAAFTVPKHILGVDDDSVNIEFLLDVKLHVTFEVGRSKMLITDLLTLGQGSVIELHRLVGDELDLLINGKLVAKGEVVVINEKFGCRISEIIPPEDRVKYLSGY